MKTISNEFKVGLIALLTIVAFIWLFNFLKGKNIFSPTYSYYVVYNEVNGLTETNPVEINGFKAGVVQSIEFINDYSGRLLVKLSVDKDYLLPRNTIAEITPASLIAGMKIRLLFGSGPGNYVHGDTIQGRVDVSVLKRAEEELLPLKEKISLLIVNLDSVLTGINDILSPEFTANVRSAMKNLNSTTASVDKVMSDNENGLPAIMDDLSKFSAMLSENSSAMGSTIDNLKSISDSLAAADIYSAILNLKVTLEKTSELMGGLNEGKGTAGQLLTNDSLYVNLDSSIKSLDLLLQDLKANPKRYVRFSVFGGKN